MVTVEVRDAVPGLVLAKAVYAADGSLLLEAGTELDSHTIDLLDLWGISHIAAEAATPRAGAVASPLRFAGPTRSAVPAAVVRQDPRWDPDRRVRDKERAADVGRRLNEETKRTLETVGAGRGDIDGPRLKQVAAQVIEEAMRAQETMLALTTVLDYDTYLFSHCAHVSILSVVMGLAMGVSRAELGSLASGGLLVDIGMTRIDPSIWGKKGPLTDEEFTEIKKHPVLALPEAERLLGNDHDALKIIVQHHERMDGSGYPRKLGASSIHPLARIVAVCDVYEAMQAPRTYRRTWLPHQVMNHLLVSSTETLDAEVVKVFLRTMAAYPIGSFARLDNGDIGVVVSANRNSPIRPVVKVFRDALGAPKTPSEFVDLATTKRFIVGPVDPRALGTTSFEAY